MDEGAGEGRGERERLLDPIDRISEILFGLIMAVTIVGSLSIASAGSVEVRTVTAAALGCNLAWGLVDAVMYLVRTLTEGARLRSLAQRVRGADSVSARRLLQEGLPPHVLAITGREELEGMQRRLLALPVPDRPVLSREDYLAAFGIFVLVVVATFPVVLPFMLVREPALAMRISQTVTVVMLFVAGFALGRHAGHARPLATGAAMSIFGVVLIAAVKALGG